ncbi:MAG: threonine synthase [Patescibacteria group bacterium]|nr:threonine synthase [Patescibacteria group bacterium]
MEKAFTMDQTWLQCMNCGHRADLLEERKFRCPECGGLYDIEHNFKRLPVDLGDDSSGRKWSFKSLSSRYFRELFQARAGGAFNSFKPECVSGIWRYKEWIMPYLPEGQIVTLHEGNVPIVPAGKNLQAWVGDVELYIIMEGMTPTGSFKDFGGTVMMSIAKAAGIKAVCCASTGDTSAMAAAYAAAAGLACVVILPRGKVTPVQLAQPLVHGARVITLPGSFDDCMRVMQELVREYGIYPANSLNPSRIEGHQATVFQIAQRFNWNLPDWISVPVGNGSNCSSVGKALRLMKKFGFQAPTKILGCQSTAADPLSFPWFGGITLEKWKADYSPIKVGETSATAARIGDPVSRDKVMREILASHGAMQTAAERELNEAVAICGKDGHNVCPQTGMALAGVRNALKCGQIKAGERVIVVSTATGLKFGESAAANLKSNIINATDCKISTVAKIMEL